MGCKGPKSLISVRNENTFLDLTVQQIEVQYLPERGGELASSNFRFAVFKIFMSSHVFFQTAADS